jgi:YqaJ-like viral recombinase domain
MITIHYCQQGTPEWHELRLGLPTMSRAATIQARGRSNSGESLTRKKYLYELAAERLTGRLNDAWTNAHMDRGKAQEAVARSIYAFAYEVEPSLIGFISDSERGCGCSPDALIRDGGLLEIKTRLPHLQVELLAMNRPPPEHYAQVQGGLVIYSPGLPLYVERVRRDEKYIKALADEVERFNIELEEVCAKVGRYGKPLIDTLREIVL